jgi:predicted PhzF superfamily epimerase YddE/YHI9
VSVRLFQVDAFTDRPFAGNPAAVCLLAGPADEAWMQAVAAENNLPETAFVTPPDAGGTRGLRWFTPTVEVDLCGHATLATAHVLTTEAGLRGPNAESGGTERSLTFATRSGVLTAAVVSGGIEIDLPAIPSGPLDDAARADAARAAVGAPAGSEVFTGSRWVLVNLDTAGAVRSCTPDLGAVAALTDVGVIVTGAGDADDLDVVSRMFAPSMGIDEDPVTGAAHCLLGPYWAVRLGRTRLRAHQASARGGDLVMEVRGERVALTGRAVTVLRADLLA